MNASSDKAQSVEDADLDRLDLSVRASNCLRRAEVVKVAQLAALTQADILRWHGAGIKTLQEIRSVLGSLGLCLSGDRGPVGSVNEKLLHDLSVLPAPIPGRTICFNTSTAEIKRRLIVRLKNLKLSMRAENVLFQNKLLYLGELIQLHQNDIRKFKNSGRHTVRELSDLVESFGFGLGTSIPDWSRTKAASHEAALSSAIAGDATERSDKLLASIGPSPSCLEEELDRIARALGNDRNAQIIKKLWGWNGQDPRTLESVGSELTITRERVRQIEARALKHLQKYRFDTPYLRSAVDLLRKCTPGAAKELSEKLSEAGISRKSFSVWSVRDAAKTFGIKWSLRRVHIGPNKIFVGSDHQDKLATVLHALRRKTSELGCTSILSLASEAKIDEQKQETIVKFLECVPEIEWLDAEKEWLFTRATARNRLINLVSKVLGVCPQIRISELRKAVSKSRRLTMVPPKRILAEFIRRSGLGQIEGEFVVANANVGVAPAEVSSEGRMLRVLDEFGPVMDGEEFAERCIGAGINATTFYIYRLISPVFCALGKGVYCKVGCEVPPGIVEDIVGRRRSVAKFSDYGWTNKGSLWFGIELTRVVITAGSIRVPPFVRDFVQGEWQVTLPDGTDCGHVTARDFFIWSFRKAFAPLGAEPGDLAAFEFDLKNRKVVVKVGGPGLFEAIQEPENIMGTELSDNDA
jgi:hypothetical protein